ncbi:hypothetical protein U1Q18_002517, partial [Sarracenia purpurea var. burkii]
MDVSGLGSCRKWWNLDCFVGFDFIDIDGAELIDRVVAEKEDWSLLERMWAKRVKRVEVVAEEDDLEIRMGGVRSGIEGRKGFEMDWSGIWAYGGEDR